MPSRKTVCLRIAILLVFLFAGLIIYKTQPNMEIQGEESPVSATGFYFNTSIKITLYDSRDSSLLDQCMELCETYENLFSRTDPDSELYRLNHRQLPETSRGYEVSDDTARLIKKGWSTAACPAAPSILPLLRSPICGILPPALTRFPLPLTYRRRHPM